jgi:hypothetical protein
MIHTVVVSEYLVEIHLSMNPVTLFVLELGDEAVAVFDADVLGGFVETHIGA